MNVLLYELYHILYGCTYGLAYCVYLTLGPVQREEEHL